MRRDERSAADALGAIIVSILAAAAAVGLIGVVLLDEGDETYAKLLAVTGGLLAILAFAHFAMLGWSRVMRGIATLSSSPTAGVDDGSE
jgi:hypothetical protein